MHNGTAEQVASSSKICSPGELQSPGGTSGARPSATASKREGLPAARCREGALGAARGGRSELVDGWCELLERWDWPWFCTFTFREYTHPEQADRRFRRLIYEMNRELYPYRVRVNHKGREHMDLKGQEGVYWMRAMEWQKRGVIHYHALIGGVGNLRRLTWMDRWNEMSGYARIQPPRGGGEAVRRYCAKYVSKRSHLGEIDLGGRLTRFKPFIPRLAG